MIRSCAAGPSLLPGVAIARSFARLRTKPGLSACVQPCQQYVQSAYVQMRLFVAPDFTSYRVVSSDVRNIFQRHTDLIEPLSLDEAYLDVTSRQELRPRLQKQSPKPVAALL